MVAVTTLSRPSRPLQGVFDELAAVFDILDDAALLDRLRQYRPTGRQGYPLRSLWRSYVASFILNLPHTNALIRRLCEDPKLRSLCGFAGGLPERPSTASFSACPTTPGSSKPVSSKSPAGSRLCCRT